MRKIYLNVTSRVAASLLARETDRAGDTKLLRYINYIRASFIDHNEIRDEPVPRQMATRFD